MGQALWLKKFLPDLKVVDCISRPLKMYCDNEPAVFYAHNNKSSNATKSIDIKYYFVKDKLNYKSRAYKDKGYACGSTNERLTTQCVQGTQSRHGINGKPMIPGLQRPKSNKIC